MTPQVVYTANDVYTVSDPATSVIAQVHLCTPFALTSSIHALLLPCYSQNTICALSSMHPFKCNGR